MIDNEHLIRRGRACVRLIEAVDVLLKDTVDPFERIALEEARAVAVQCLRMLVRDSDPAITAQILVASDKGLGTVKDVKLN